MLKEKLRIIVILLTFCTYLVFGEWHDNAGPWVIATNGEPWPLPLSRVLHNSYYKIQPTSFTFQITEKSCDILEKAIARYKQIILNESQIDKKTTKDHKNIIYEESLTGIDIHLNQPCELYPHLESNESYTLNIPKKDIHLTNDVILLEADSIWGILRGLETFSQLLSTSANGSALTIRGQKIMDRPKLPHRGLLLDTSRHFFPVADIFLTLDAMAYNKLNVFHWHIVDDNSFPYESVAFPELSAKGAYHFSMIYSPVDVQHIIEYARQRGIRVIPEFDTPGHTRSWGLARPNLLTPCYDEDQKPTEKLGPMNPANDKIYEFLNTLLTEVTEKFPDKYIHLGGDEVPFDCWKSNPEIVYFMEKNNISTKFEKLEDMYIQRIMEIVLKLNAKPIVWQEVFNNGVTLSNGTLVQVWTGDWQAEMAAVTKAGYFALLSACWYLDHVASGGDWLKYYNCDPLNFNSTSTNQKTFVLGGEACMWGEFVDRNNVHSRIWPRASAAAERLWSGSKQDEKIAAQRLEEHACRMNRRGVPAQPPNGSGFCIS